MVQYSAPRVNVVVDKSDQQYLPSPGESAPRQTAGRELDFINAMRTHRYQTGEEGYRTPTTVPDYPTDTPLGRKLTAAMHGYGRFGVPTDSSKGALLLKEAAAKAAQAPAAPSSVAMMAPPVVPVGTGSVQGPVNPVVAAAINAAAQQQSAALANSWGVQQTLPVTPQWLTTTGYATQAAPPMQLAGPSQADFQALQSTVANLQGQLSNILGSLQTQVAALTDRVAQIASNNDATLSMASSAHDAVQVLGQNVQTALASVNSQLAQENSAVLALARGATGTYTPRQITVPAVPPAKVGILSTAGSTGPTGVDGSLNADQDALKSKLAGWWR